MQALVYIVIYGDLAEVAELHVPFLVIIIIIIIIVIAS